MFYKTHIMDGNSSYKYDLDFLHIAYEMNKGVCNLM
jgi:hypothetical protein